MTDKEEWFKEIKDTYPGIKRFVSCHRDFETGLTHILVFDLDIGEEPIYLIRIHPRHILILRDGLTLPICTMEEEKVWHETGVKPPGWITAIYPQSEEC